MCVEKPSWRSLTSRPPIVPSFVSLVYSSSGSNISNPYLLLLLTGHLELQAGLRPG